MDSIWITRPFTVSNDSDLTRSEPSCCEIHRLQEICRISELMRRQACLDSEKHQSNTKTSPKSCARISTSRNNCLGQKFEDDEHGIHFRVPSRSVSCLQRKIASSSTTVLKMHSRTSLKKPEEIENNYFPNVDASSTKGPAVFKHFANKKDKTFEANAEINDKFDTHNLLKCEKCGSSSSKTEESQVSSRRMQSEEDRNIGGALFSCPFDLVEIYSSKKGDSSENDCNKRYDTLNRGTSSMRSFSKENSDECEIVPEENDFLFSQLKLNEVKDTKSMECVQENSKIESFRKDISCLVKDVMAESEEKENVRSPRRYKAMQRRMVNSLSINDTKQKAGHVRSKYVRPCLAKKESAIETQMSFVSNSINALRQSKSKILTKPLHSSKTSKKEKHLDDTQASIIDKKVIDSSRHPERAKPSKILLNTNANQYKQSVYRQKHRASCNQQPVWRPGGAVRTPSSNSTTVLSQKTRVPMHVKERGNLDATKEGAHGRRTNESRKRPSSEILNIDSSKVTGKRSNTSLRISLKTKPKRTFPQNLDVFCALKQTNIIPPQVNDEEKSEKLIHSNQQHNETNSLNRPHEPTLVKIEVKISEEEPTRDVDSNQCTRNQSGINEKLLADHSFIPFSTTDVKETAEDAGLKGNLQLNGSSNFACDFKSNPTRTDDLETLKLCQAIFNSISPSTTFYQEPKGDKSKENDISQTCMLDRNENQQKEGTKKSKICNNPSVMKKGKTVVNSHAVSLSMLKEFLYDQGIDVDLVNKAEKYLKDKQKTRKYLKKKSISFAEVPSGVEYSTNLERTVKSEHREEEELQGEMRTSGKDFINDKTDSNQSSSQSVPKMKDTATSTVKDSNNASSQTDVHCKTSKCLQTSPENNALIVTQMQVIQTQTKIEQRDEYSMTEPHSISCGFAEFDPARNFNLQDFKEKIHKYNNSYPLQNDKLKNANNCPLKPAEATKSTNSKSTECKINDNDKNSSRECHRVLEQLSNNIREECDESLMNYQRTDSADELCSIESNASLSSNCSDSSIGSSEKNLREIVTKDKGQSPIRVISSETVAALQVAAIRARNIYRAIDIYKRILSNDAKKLKNRLKRKKKINHVSKTRKEESTHISRSSSAIKIVMQRKNSDRNGIIEMSRVLKQAEVASALSGTSFDLDSESQEDVFKSVDTSLKCVSSDESDPEIVELIIPKRSSSSVVLRDVRSVMKFLINETDHGMLEGIEGIQKWSNSNACVRFRGNWEMEVVKTKKRFSLFSRENLLPLIYGVMCSIVFWCLQFTITCDVVS